MAIAPNPKRNPIAFTDAQANNFISGAGKTEIAEDSGRKPIVLRIPADLLKKIDAAAKRKSINRSSFIVSSLADLMNGGI